jgi:hypothetical protein
MEKRICKLSSKLSLHAKAKQFDGH